MCTLIICHILRKRAGKGRVNEHMKWQRGMDVLTGDTAVRGGERGVDT